MTRCIAHLSDLHFGAEEPAVVAALAADLHRSPPDLLVVSGDLTQRARHREFAAAMTFLRQVKAPLLAVPGNHDLTPYKLIERFANPYGRWRRHVGPETEPVFQDAEIAVIGLNTARRGGLYLNWARGGVSRGRLRRIEQRLASLPGGLFRIVVAHHPFVAPALAPEARTVGNAVATLAAFARHGVGLVLTGHLHLGDVQPLGGGGPLLVQAATATSYRLRGTPNAYNRIIVQDGQAQVTTRVWGGAAWRDEPAQHVLAA